MTAAAKDASPWANLLAGPLVELSPRWVRVRFEDEVLADSTSALLLRQYGPGALPTYYFPQTDVNLDLLQPESEGENREGFRYWTVKVGARQARKAAWTYLSPPQELAALKGYLSFAWPQMDAWYEEEEEIFVHARDPYKRVDVLASSRHVRVEIEDQTVAESRRLFLLFETLLPTRYYLPRADVRMDLLAPSDLTTRCPYKGLASYWSLQLGEKRFENLVWSYAEPIPENPKIKGLMCFYNERVDLYVDGELQERPFTPWS